LRSPLPALDRMPLPVVVEFDRDENMLPFALDNGFLLAFGDMTLWTIV
jgi:hypothetical protein